MMGLQATLGKRKLEGGVSCIDFDMELGESPSKVGHVEASWWAMDDNYDASMPTASYYDMEVVTSPCFPSSCNNSINSISSSTSNTSNISSNNSSSGLCQLSNTGSTTNLSLSGAHQPALVGSQSQCDISIYNHHHQQQQLAHSSSSLPHHHHQQHQQPTNQQQYYSRSNTLQNYLLLQNFRQSQQQNTPPQQNSTQQLSRPQQLASQWDRHIAVPHHYEPPTIRREENGKSYLELGSSYRANEQCCEGSRLSWCRRGRACYRQRRSAIWNISMFKLSQFRQFPDPSLHRSVLICNTLRYLEREMERDRSPPPMEPIMPSPIAQLQPEQGRLTPFPLQQLSSAMETDMDSGIGDSNDSRSINWGSVLSLSSQSSFDPIINNNELLDVDIGTDLDINILPNWKLTPLTTSSITTVSSTSLSSLSLSSSSSSSSPPSSLSSLCSLASSSALSQSSSSLLVNELQQLQSPMTTSSYHISSNNGSSSKDSSKILESPVCVNS